jgi:multicomponent K+:H+ antiporter subunit E/multicomponent Na+:H+ antiporter subunit E
LNFVKSAFFSGLDAAIIILRNPGARLGGLTEIPYGELNENTASLLGAMITLTPGTTLVDINTDTRVLVLHMIDLEQRDETVRIIQRDFCDYLKTLNEAMR